MGAVLTERSEHMKHTNIRRKVITTVILLAVGILFLLPLLWMISSSLKPGSEVFSTDFTWIPSKFVWKTYEQVFTSKSVPFLNMIKNSLVLATATIVGQLLVSSLAAYAFACIDFKGKNIVFIMLLGAMMIPSQATLIPRFILFNSMGLYNTHWALLLPSWFSVSAVFLLRQFYQKIPRDLVEAAVIDGAGHFRIWWQVMMPLTKTAMVSLTILAFIGSWNDFLTPLIFLTDKDLFTVSLGINLYNSMEQDLINKVMAAATVGTVPVILIFSIFQKQFVEGITTSGIKG